MTRASTLSAAKLIEERLRRVWLGNSSDGNKLVISFAISPPFITDRLPSWDERAAEERTRTYLADLFREQGVEAGGGSPCYVADLRREDPEYRGPHTRITYSTTTQHREIVEAIVKAIRVTYGIKESPDPLRPGIPDIPKTVAQCGIGATT
jgi:hypothetical protein